MVSIKVIAVGSLTEKFYQNAQDEFLKRLSRFAKVTVLEIKDEKAPQKTSEKMRQNIMEAEAKRALEKIAPSDYVIVLDLGGKMLTSEELAAKMEELMQQSDSLVFVIGGSLGLHSSILSRANFRLCLSKMTFTHNMARIFLLEQLYRGFKIINGEPYHK